MAVEFGDTKLLYSMTCAARSMSRPSVPKRSGHYAPSSPLSHPVSSRGTAKPNDGGIRLNSHRSSSSSSSSNNEDLVQMRRFILMSSTLCLASTGFPSWALASNDKVTVGLQKYMKKKRVDSIDSYVPTLLNARAELIRLDRIMGRLKGFAFWGQVQDTKDEIRPSELLRQN